ncbi:LOW QUALITY PROTEIN: Pol protein [Phytophthora palmivora]|uniref:Pol protein n=1 Tax=Phytophthora palmivora TaxID=4796 RepID=A0A2P4YH87_9STRA|nr:LOW QUALITY PROTEIN: Pol protein [Phytophthora palmivora]
MPWLEKHESWIDWRGKPLGLAGPQSLTEHRSTDNDAVEENAEGVFGVGNIIQRKVEETKSTNGQEDQYEGGGSLSTFRVDNQVPHSESVTPPARPVEYQYHVFGCVSGRQVKAGAVHLEALSEVPTLLNLEELSMKDFLAELKAGEIAEMMLLKPETSPEDLNSSSVMDEDVLEGFTKQRATRLGSEILKTPEDPVYSLVNEFSDVVSKHPPSQLPPGRGVRHKIDLVPDTKYCVTSLWSPPHEYYEMPDFAEKAKSGMVQELKSPHSTPTFCWRLVHAYNKLHNATVSAQTPIPHKDVLLNNMSGYPDAGAWHPSHRSEHPEWDALGVTSDATGTIECPSDIQSLGHLTYFDDIFVHSRAEGGQTAMEAHLKHLHRVFAAMRANKRYANIDKVGVRADPGKVKALRLSRPQGHKRTSGSGWA